METKCLLNLAVAPEFELTEWATKKVHHRMWKSANWEVRGIAMCAVYQVLTPYGSHIVDLIKNDCTCRYLIFLILFDYLIFCYCFPYFPFN